MTIFLRYIAACMIATIASFLLLFLLTGISGTLISQFPKHYNILGPLLPNITFIIIGFSGTFIGSYCLPRSARVFGAIVLAILGLMAGCIFWMVGASFVGMSHASLASSLRMEAGLLFGALLNIWIHKMRSSAKQGPSDAIIPLI